MPMSLGGAFRLLIQAGFGQALLLRTTIVVLCRLGRAARHLYRVVWRFGGMAVWWYGGNQILLFYFRFASGASRCAHH